MLLRRCSSAEILAVPGSSMHRWVGGLKGTKSGMLARPVPLQKGERACVVGVQGLCPIINFAGGLKQQKPGFGHWKKVDFF